VRVPNLFSAGELKNPPLRRVSEHGPDGLFRDGWVPARPESNVGLLTRFHLAWGVLTGRYDAVVWYDTWRDSQ
jgi:hypothetical protein